MTTEQAWNGLYSVDADNVNNTCIVVQPIKKHLSSVGPIGG